MELRLTPLFSDLHTSGPDWLHFCHFAYFADTADPRPFPGTELYNSDVQDSASLSIHCKSAEFQRFTRNCHLPLVSVRDPNRPYIFSKSHLYNSFKIDSDTQMYLWSSALIFYIDSDFSLRHMSMDVSSVLAALSSHGVPWVTGANVQVASPRGCTLG